MKSGVGALAHPSGGIIFGSKQEPQCRPLAEIAALLARRLQVQLRLVHVSEDARAHSLLATDEEHLLGSIRSELNAEVERLRAFSGADVRGHLTAGNVADALLSVAATDLPAALVLGGETGGKSGELGTTVESVFRKSEAPVLLLREPARMLEWLRRERALRVLVGADLGRASESARAFASAWSALGEVEVEVAWIATPSEVRERLRLSSRESEPAMAQQVQAVLAGDLRRCAPAAEVGAKLRVMVARGSADSHLASVAEQENFDLVVIGRSPRAVADNAWYGSVSRGVLRSAPVNVASVPAVLGVRGPVFHAPRVVLVATDFGEAGKAAVAQGIGTVVEGGTIHLVHVVAAGTASSEEARQAREQAWYALARLASGGAEGRARVERHVLEGAPTFELLALAERVGVDLIVLGARSRFVRGRGSLGSVARSVSERAKVPVLLVPVVPRA